MIRKILSIAVLLVMFIAASGSIVQGEPWDQVNAEKDAAEEIQQTVSGDALVVNELEKTVTVLSEGYIGTYYAEEATSYISAGSLSDISSGDKIKIDYYVYKGKNLIDTIILEEKGPGTDNSSKASKEPLPVLVD